jgi:DNA polymerase V
MLALCDCNNFFVSCERLYYPELRNRPVVILSNNDGCIISRSNEVKAMGIPMGQPYFQVQALLKKKGVVVCSGNLVLYKEISEKVMQALGRFSDVVEKYSIDEAFLNFPKSAVGDPEEYAKEIRWKVDRLVGIPVSIGVADTKTLAKLASEKAKKSGSGVLRIAPGTAKDLLDATPVGDVWGIGRKSAEYLNRWGICTAGDFARKDSLWVKKALTVKGLMTQLELRGQACLPLVAPLPPKSIQVSRTWGSVLESHEDITSAMIDNVVKAGRLLRQDRLAAGAISVYMRYGYRHHGECGYFTEDIFFNSPIWSDIELIAAARRMIDKIYRPGYRYTQGGVTLCNFSEARFRQRELFDDGSYERRSKYERFSDAIDEINEHFGKRTIYPASLAVKDKKWRPNRKHLLSLGL